MLGIYFEVISEGGRVGEVYYRWNKISWWNKSDEFIIVESRWWVHLGAGEIHHTISSNSVLILDFPIIKS